MTLNDLVALAKQGYKPADVKELISMAEVPQTATEAPQTDTVEHEVEIPAQADTNALQQAMADEIAELKAQLQKTNEALKTAQRVNTQQNVQISTKQSDVDVINDWARSFM